MRLFMSVTKTVSVRGSRRIVINYASDDPRRIATDTMRGGRVGRRDDRAGRRRSFALPRRLRQPGNGVPTAATLAATGTRLSIR